MSENVHAPDHDQDPGTPDPNLQREAPGTNLDDQPTGELTETEDAARTQPLQHEGLADEPHVQRRSESGEVLPEDTQDGGYLSQRDDHAPESVGELDAQRERAAEQAVREGNSLVDNAQDSGFDH